MVSAVHETVLDLGDDAGAQVLRVAGKCGAKPFARGYATTKGGVIDMLLDVDPTHAVAVTFDERSGLTTDQKQDLLARAVALLDG